MNTIKKEIATTPTVAKKPAFNLGNSSFNTRPRNVSLGGSMITLNKELAKKYEAELPNQLLIIAGLVESVGGKCTVESLAQHWDTEYLMTKQFRQDVYTVLAHYRGAFNSKKGFKQLPKEDLNKIFTFSS
jgi:hypothetical protein